MCSFQISREGSRGAREGAARLEGLTSQGPAFLTPGPSEPGGPSPAQETRAGGLLRTGGLLVTVSQEEPPRILTVLSFPLVPSQDDNIMRSLQLFQNVM